MAHDPKLVRVLASLRWRRKYPQGISWEETYAPERAPIIKEIEEDLAEIEASGTHWVAPWHSTEAMLEFEAEHTWAMMRDAYLAERRGDEG